MNTILRATLSISLGLFTLTASAANLTDWQHTVIKEVETLYEPISKAQNQSFSIEVNESSMALSGGADSENRKLKVTLDRGLLQSTRLSPDGLRVLVCHELGHLFGGSPRKSPPYEWDGPLANDGLTFMSSEGQADYYASLVCFRQLVAGQDHQKALSSSAQNSSRVSQLCKASHSESPENAMICQRAAYGALNMLQLAMDFPISLEKQDTANTPALIRNTYPERQCRLDTVFAGALCRKKFPAILDMMDSQKNDCDQEEAKRPKCWYR